MLVFINKNLIDQMFKNKCIILRKNHLLVKCGFFVLIILDLLALDDITTNNQPYYYAEFAMLGISVAIFISFFTWVRRN